MAFLTSVLPEPTVGRPALWARGAGALAPPSAEGNRGWQCAWIEFPRQPRVPWLVRGRITVRRGAQPPLDIRARVAGRIFSAVLGPALSQTSSVVEGFDFEINLHGSVGSHRVRLEAWAGEGRWREFSTAGVKLVSAVEPPQPGWQPWAPDERLLRFLRVRQQFPQQDAAAGARLVAEMETMESRPVVPEAPWWGNLEGGEPTSPLVFDHGLISVGGWVAHERQRVIRIEAWVHPWLPAVLARGLVRPDVATVFPALCCPLESGFSGQIPVPASLSPPWNLTVVATLADGTRAPVFVRRLRGPVLAEEVHDELPVYSRALVWAALRQLKPALGGWWGIGRSRAALWSAVQQFRANAATDESQAEVDFWRPPVAIDPAAHRISVVMVSDNLTLGGAAWFAYEYAYYLKSELGWPVRVIAPEDGPMRTIWETAGFMVDIVPEGVALGREGLRAGAVPVALDWRQADLVIVNTLVAHWAVPLARHWRKPSLLYLHEGARLRRLCGAQTSETLERASAQAIREATRVVLLTRWTYANHAPHQRAGHFRLLRSWVDLRRLDVFAARHDAVELRRRHGIGAHSFVFACLGSICERKGQRVLLHAVQWLRRGRRPEAGNEHDLVVLLVGARATPDVAQLREEISRLGLTEIRLIDETPQVLEFLHLADAYVCPSYEEGFPRALMEAAALRKWIVATAIPGNREMLSENEAWLVPAGDPPAMAQAMVQARAAALAGQCDRPEAARWRMERWYDDTQSLPVHAALAAETATRSYAEVRDRPKESAS